MNKERFNKYYKNESEFIYTVSKEHLYNLKELISILNDNYKNNKCLGIDNLSNDIFQWTLSESLVLKSYALLEKTMIKLCRLCETLLEIDLGVEDLYGKGIVRSATYLEKVIGFDNVKSNKWNEIKQWGRIRNLIIHNGGEVDNTEVNKIKTTVYVDEDIFGNFISIDYRDVLSFIDVLESYLEYLFSLEPKSDKK
ncbi:hypothetical protein GOQ27_06990 [Clostridium sp. D2Q-11]|uniref:Uncharacterized protein n=1 Tax=Anaeromonas frigoriresistens TaxID=2683708 RepID=A0A942V1B7_9FIRM|nr:hypothetical protein [Anaeromonas frigoriresistens]MBS4538202.1 hypothetical protein [Anaeromonas frigoriresistens]